VYQVSNPAVLLRSRAQQAAASQPAARVAPTVLLLGLTSLLTDISSEMVATVLPLYLVYVGGFSPLAFGIIDGFYNGAAALIGLASGFVGDRWRRHKEVAVTGYGLSAVSRLLLATIGTALSGIGALVLLDRIGKGIRTAPRDAMISLATPRKQLGLAFGVHRAMDTTGAMIGPLVAFALLTAAPFAFHSLFLVSFCIALVGLAVLVMFVRPSTSDDAVAAPAASPSLGRALRLLRVPRYRAVVIAGATLSVVTISDAFVFLALQRKLDLGLSMFPLLYVVNAAVYMTLAVPMGRLADRIGRGRVWLGGYVLLFAVYVVLLLPVGGWAAGIGVLGLLGAYYAATDGVMMALGSTVVPDELRGSGLALLGTATNVAKLLASLIFGALWAVWSIDTAIVAFGGGLVLAGTLAVALFVRAPETRHV
jgi:MFS family permease